MAKSSPAASVWYAPFYNTVQNKVIALGFTPAEIYSDELIPITYENSKTLTTREKLTHSHLEPRLFYCPDINGCATAISLGGSTSDRGFALLPLIGFANLEIAKIVDKLSPRKNSLFNAVTMQNVYLMGDSTVRVLPLAKNDDQNARALEVIAKLHKFGIPWVEQNASLETIRKRYLTGPECTPEAFACALQAMRFDVAQEKLNVLLKKRKANLEIWTKQCSDLTPEQVIEFCEVNLRPWEFWRYEYIDKVQTACDAKSLDCFGL